ncbi:MAG: hypothetical protein LUI04_07280 [Porphyromonadaceae bacterium]|nr:hypothetical protein [Porphyromonadaceae bacterium]
MAGGKEKLAKGEAYAEPDNDLCKVCRGFHEDCGILSKERMPYGKGTIEIYDLVMRSDSDYERLMQIARAWAEEGKKVTLTPRMSRYPDFRYHCVYGSLRGTRYENKCPDMLVDGKWYEHEGYTTTNMENALHNMMKRGFKQASRVIIDETGLTDRYMLKRIYDHIKAGAAVNEVWIRNEKGVRLLYKAEKEIPDK